ncbi:MAG: glycosyltransferase family 4 protein [Candidatus Eisenbacteria bacterium]|uniref:Glycosyltransferase family 4 protein n=1 Tax=Eiseniibacteriota bacterium TaxID=2212470 RepID=A0A948RWQ8_UNCEI|nr:glycosyltransferase family 4 protein [Candidatus Eisenbacteria bacterium]MBU1950556.1 glycosyltransferase family 4 protein [Candidatus Eisenbacteria bacterium]MBU2690958.1 glycosyltransferase family 4 protein [Candidatus Eisenbacteria bacterium]
MMKILLLAPCPFFQGRGTPIAIKLVAEVLAGEGHHLHILTYPEGEAVPIPNGSISRIPALPGIRDVKPGPSWKKLVYDPILLFKAIDLIRKKHFDVIHAVEESVFIALILKKIFRIPFVYDLDSSMSQQIVEKYPLLKPLKPCMHYCERTAIKESAGALAVCKALEEEVLACDPSHLVCRLEDISLLPDQEWQEDPPAPRLFQEPVMMYVGNLEKYQGIDLLIEGFQKALPKMGKAKLVIIGGHASEMAAYQKRVKDMGMGEEVAFLGPKPLSELASWFNQARILVSPRLQGNNTPMKIYSYLDSGKPVLATRLPTHTQVLDDEIAYLVSPTPESMAQGMAALMEDGALRARLSQAAKKRVQDEYCLEAYRKKLSAFYDRLEAKIRG